MAFDPTQMRAHRAFLRRRLPQALRQELDKASQRLGRQGVRIAASLVAVDTGQTRRSIKYRTIVRRETGRGWYYGLQVVVDDDKVKSRAIKAFVTEFGRGHGKAGHRARGPLPPRPYLRRSRELVNKRARGAFTRAMRAAARSQFATPIRG